ncbi:pyridoxal phosphate-dependent transferase [Ochromonadaceae sp. CCMP2298]|nr:pyridoxal phosphate-dependent transferase [Ochromonadaceae sp. CCMP2298]
MDLKTSYRAPLLQFDYQLICRRAFTTSGVSVRTLQSSQPVSTRLRALALAAGASSRFAVDPRIPRAGFEAMFGAWVENSANRSIADEVFVAYEGAGAGVEAGPEAEEETGAAGAEGGDGKEIGFVTVRRRDNVVNIGLLATSQIHRRRGVALALLSRAVLWALELLGSARDAQMHVVTQDKELAYVEQVVADGIVSSSHFTSSCATRIAKLLGAAGKVLVVQSGTAALELAALLCNLQPGDEVILPSFTFASTANAFVLRGAVPVFVDVRRDTLNIDETLIEAAITPHTKAICCVHYAGVSCEMGAIMGIARRHKLLVIEDAAQAFMARYKGQPLGTIGDYGCFSFHYTKNIVCGEGGALVVNRSAECANRAEIVKEKGTNRNDFLLGKTSKYYWMDVGSSFVPSELSCAVLLSQLDQAEHITKTRRRIFEMYTTGLQELLQQGIQTPTVPADCYNNAHIFYILLPSPEVCGRVQDALAAAGVAAFSHYEPLHSAPAGVKYCRAVGTMEVTDTISACLLRLPIWIDLKDEQVQFVIDAVKRASTL